MAKNILITGTNSGFGKLTAVALARQGHHVFATMRDVAGRNRAAADELTRAGQDTPGAIEVLDVELTSQASVDAAVGAVLAKVGHLDIVINNAGYAAFGLEETLTDEQVLRQLDVNVVGPHRVLRAVLPGMRERKAGYVIAVSSGLGRLVFPAMGAYCASKAALESLFDAYRYELKAVGVEATIVQPGAFPTEFATRLDTGKDQDRAGGYGPMSNVLEQMGAAFETMLNIPGRPGPELVVDAIVGLVDAAPGARPQRVVVDVMNPKGIEDLNEAHEAAQRVLLSGMGWGDLA